MQHEPALQQAARGWRDAVGKSVLRGAARDAVAAVSYDRRAEVYAVDADLVLATCAFSPPSSTRSLAAPLLRQILS